MSQSTTPSQSDVKLFALFSCSHCKDTKQFLTDHGVDFDVVHVDILVGEERREVIAELKKVNPRCTFPTVVIGEQVVVGFKKEEITDALGLK